MPSKSQAQHRLMAWAAHNPKEAKARGIDPEVAKEFVEADKHDHSYQKREHVSKEAEGEDKKEQVGEAIARVRDFTEEQHIPEDRAQKIIQAEIEEVSKEDQVVDENDNTQYVDEHGQPQHDPLTAYLDAMSGSHSDLPYDQPKAVVTLEGFVDSLKGFFNPSQKGADYKAITESHTYNHNGLRNLIQKFYGNEQWLSKQKFQTTPVKAQGIADFMPEVKSAADLLTALKTAGAFYLALRQDLFKGIVKRNQALEPVAAMLLKEGFSDEAFAKAHAQVKTLPWGDALLTKVPTDFPVGGRSLSVNPRTTTPEAATGELAPLTATDVKAVVTLISNDLEQSWTLGDKGNAFPNISKVNNDCFTRIVHGEGKLPAKTQLSRSQWKSLAALFDYYETYWSSKAHSHSLKCYNDLMLATGRWIDRSIR